jgi:small basic protein
MIISLEKWFEVFYDAMLSGSSFIINIFYFVSWIFIGNYMLLNLFLAIMLDSFS